MMQIHANIGDGGSVTFAGTGFKANEDISVDVADLSDSDFVYGFLTRTDADGAFDSAQGIASGELVPFDPPHGGPYRVDVHRRKPGGFQYVGKTIASLEFIV